jgi:hypothetical protein
MATTYYMSSVLLRHPMLVYLSKMVQSKTLEAMAVAEELTKLEGEEYREHIGEIRALDLKLDHILDGLLDVAYELKEDYGVLVCDPELGEIDIPVYACSAREVVHLCFGPDTPRDGDQMYCHEFLLGGRMPQKTAWRLT